VIDRSNLSIDTLVVGGLVQIANPQIFGFIPLLQIRKKHGPSLVYGSYISISLYTHQYAYTFEDILKYKNTIYSIGPLTEQCIKLFVSLLVNGSMDNDLFLKS
jgi:hypothetical protein